MRSSESGRTLLLLCAEETQQRQTYSFKRMKGSFHGGPPFANWCRHQAVQEDDASSLEEEEEEEEIEEVEGEEGDAVASLTPRRLPIPGPHASHSPAPSLPDSPLLPPETSEHRAHISLTSAGKNLEKRGPTCLSENPPPTPHPHSLQKCPRV